MSLVDMVAFTFTCQILKPEDHACKESKRRPLILIQSGGDGKLLRVRLEGCLKQCSNSVIRYSSRDSEWCVRATLHTPKLYSTMHISKSYVFLVIGVLGQASRGFEARCTWHSKICRD